MCWNSIENQIMFSLINMPLLHEECPNYAYKCIFDSFGALDEQYKSHIFIVQSIIRWYYRKHISWKGLSCINLWIYKRHHIPFHYRCLTGCLLYVFWEENWPSWNECVLNFDTRRALFYSFAVTCICMYWEWTADLCEDMWEINGFIRAHA